MNKSALQTELTRSHKAFLDYIQQLTDAEFSKKIGEKWTAGQQLEHIYLALRPLRWGFSLPKLAFRLLFGKNKRPSRTYAEMVDFYQSKLQQGAKASTPFVPKPVGLDRKSKLLAQTAQMVQKLNSQLDDFREQELDLLRIPHPILGKLSIREMMYFTIYHVQHHHKSTMQIVDNQL